MHWKGHGEIKNGLAVILAKTMPKLAPSHSLMHRRGNMTLVGKISKGSEQKVKSVLTTDKRDSYLLVSVRM
jgi:hypothetical protein